MFNVLVVYPLGFELKELCSTNLGFVVLIYYKDHSKDWKLKYQPTLNGL